MSIDLLDSKQESSEFNSVPISIVCSVYNSASFLSGYFKSLDAQLLAEFEVIFVDSASTDESLSLLLDYSPRQGISKQVIALDSKVSIYQAWNIAIRASKGAWILNYNSDDYLFPEALLSYFYRMQECSGYAVIYSALLVSFSPTHFPVRRYSPWRNANDQFSLWKGCCCGPFPLVSRGCYEAYGLFDESFAICGDYEMWCRLKANQVEFVYLEIPLGVYYSNPLGVSTLPDNKLQRLKEDALARRSLPSPKAFGWDAAGNISVWAEGMSPLPTVSICTLTYQREEFLGLLAKRIQEQSYPGAMIEWVVVDDSPEPSQLLGSGLQAGVCLRYFHQPQKMKLGAKRNLSHSLCSGDVIVYMDDDDFYPRTRVQHAVEALSGSDKLIAGSSAMPILFLDDGSLWMAGPYGLNHATAGTFAFKKELLEVTCYQDDAEGAEEKFFLKDYQIEMVQLQPFQAIICIAHGCNTFDKNLLRQISVAKGTEKAKFRPYEFQNDKQRRIVSGIAEEYRGMSCLN